MAASTSRASRAPSIKVVESKIQGSDRRAEGGSTITQQVAKNFLLSSERSMERKLKEAILAIRIERAYSKDKILELYLNEIYFGIGAYGIAAASLSYFNKELQDLTIEEVAYLAALPKGPNNYHPFRREKQALIRRNWIIGQMLENGYITSRRRPRLPRRSRWASTCARPAPTSSLPTSSPRKCGARCCRSSARTSSTTAASRCARRSIRGCSRRRAARSWTDWCSSIAARAGAVRSRSSTSPAIGARRSTRLRARPTFSLGGSASCSRRNRPRPSIGLRPEKQQDGSLVGKREAVEIAFDEMKWAKSATKKVAPKAVTDVVSPGDVIYVAPKEAGNVGGVWSLMQIPEVGGGIVALDPNTGRVLAVVGGFSFAMSQFDRAIQAKRQPGSSFKPFVYAAALDNGYKPTSIILDAPIEIEQGPGQDIWKPENYEKEHSAGPSTLRFGIEHSRNQMTVRLAQDLGMPIITDYAKRFGIYDDLLPVLSMSLGAGESTLLRLATGYCSIANGGHQVRATLIDRIQDRWGRTVWRHDQRVCEGCKAEAWNGQEEPEIPDDRVQIMDPHTAYQMTSMLEGVIQRGTATSLKTLERPLAGKTGTTNEEKDAWFIGYSPDMVVGVFMGYDTPTAMGKGNTGGKVAAPVFGSFMKEALADQPAAPFRIPPGLKLARVSLRTGLRAGEEDPQSIMEAFKPGEEPDDAYSVIGFTDQGTGAVPGRDDESSADDSYYQPPPRQSPGYGSGGGLW